MRRVALLLAVLAAAASARDAAPVRLNDVALVGTHNSYKQAMPAAVMARVRAVDPKAADALDYAHRPLAEQLDAGARQLEIDVNHDPAGGHYAAGSNDPALARPGFKVLHIPGIDNRTHCIQLAECLGQIRAWSSAHPRHLPILILVNAKDERLAARGGIDALPFDAAAWDALDVAFRAGLDERIITPGEVQGRHPTLRDAVLANAWPTLKAARGRFILALDETPAKVFAYRGGRRSLEGRAFFVNTDEASPAAAYLTLNDPVADGPRIRRAVKAGFLVRTRADANTREARANDTGPRDAALASGAQYVSTDYLWPDPRFPGRYRVAATARCNPVRRPGKCGDLGE